MSILPSERVNYDHDWMINVLQILFVHSGIVQTRNELIILR